MELGIIKEAQKREINPQISKSKPELKDYCFSSDKEYLEQYFNICELYLKKRNLIQQIWEAAEMKKNIPAQEKGAIENELNSLNIIIREQEEAFWQMVETSKEAGKLLGLTEFISHFQLDCLEKRIFLFLLFLSLCYPNIDACSDYELIHIVDHKSSPISRIRGLGSFITRESRLLKNNIIVFSTVSRGRNLYSLSDRVIPFLTKMLEKQKVNYEELSERAWAGLSETVGYIKEPACVLDRVILREIIKERVLFILEGHKRSAANKTEGMKFLFFGPPGTGKSMLAEAIAAYLGKKLLIAEFPKIASRWYGDTDRNISRLFRESERADLVLCIDEADTLLYNRNYAAQEHDIRFVNETLQELDRFKGVVIFTTNMDTLLDPALERRISLKVEFELPDEKLRSEIWKTHIPSTIRLHEDVDFIELARRYTFAGGYIKNAVQNVLRRIALKKTDIINMQDLIFGAEIENQGIFNKDIHKGILGFATQ